MTRGTIDPGPGNGAFSLVKKEEEKKKKREILNWFTRLLFCFRCFVFFTSGFVCPYFLPGELDSIDVAALQHGRSASSTRNN